jgi:hypothetical protein
MMLRFSTILLFLGLTGCCSFHVHSKRTLWVAGLREIEGRFLVTIKNEGRHQYSVKIFDLILALGRARFRSDNGIEWELQTNLPNPDDKPQEVVVPPGNDRTIDISEYIEHPSFQPVNSKIIGSVITLPRKLNMWSIDALIDDDRPVLILGKYEVGFAEITSRNTESPDSGRQLLGKLVENNDTDPEYAYTESAPVMLGDKGGSIFGPRAEESYLSNLRDAARQPIRFKRFGSVGRGPDGHLLDQFIITTTLGKTNSIYIDMYHPEIDPLSAKPPLGYYILR